LDSASIQGQVAGLITAVTTDSISNSNADWAAGALSGAAAPYLIQITSGDARGKMFLIASNVANTANTVTISADDLAEGDLVAMGLKAGDGYKIFPCDTLGSFFGTPSTTGILGGVNAKAADVVTIVVNGLPKNYFFHTGPTQNKWVENRPGFPDGSNTPLRPYYGLLYARQGADPLPLVVTGGVPTVIRSVAIKNSGTTLLAQYWPVNSTIADLGLQSMPDWQSGANARVADTILIAAEGGGAPKTYFYNGTNWLENRPGFPISNTTPIPLGSSVQVGKRAGDGYSSLVQQVPYDL
jgi:hypothetical protein